MSTWCTSSRTSNPSAFEKGQVDGAVTFDPYRAQFLRAGAATLFDSTRIPGEIVDLVAVRATVIEQAAEGDSGAACRLVRVRRIT